MRAGELHLVEDTPYLFKLNAKDVIHSFWVPEFRMKKDAVPGMTTEVRVTPTRKGRYTLACTELCGLGHSTMRATVVVEDQAAIRPVGAAPEERRGAAAGRGGLPAGEPGRRHRRPAADRRGGRGPLRWPPWRLLPTRGPCAA